jgi:hypothetical protein
MEHVMSMPAPPAVEPFYRCARRNQPIVLFRGSVDLVSSAATERHRGGVMLDWLPSPSLDCWARGSASELAMQSAMGGSGVQMIPALPTRAVPRQREHGHSGPLTASQGFETSAPLRAMECGDPGSQLSRALLHIANFPALNGPPVRWPDGSIIPGRLTFEGAGWTVLMDPAPGTSALHQELKKNRGFGLAHTACVQRTSGELFTVKELVAFVEAFTFFCWLCTETRCGPLLPVGFDGQGNAVWSRWSPTRTEPFTPAETWLDRVHGGQAEALFPLFMRRFADPYWRGPLLTLRRLIHCLRRSPQ